MTKQPGGDALIEAGQHDALIEAVRLELSRNWMTEKTLPVFLFAATLIVDRLRAGGISDLVIEKCICDELVPLTLKHTGSV